MRNKNRKELKYTLLSILSVGIFIFIWWFCIDVLQLKSQSVFPGPVKVFRSLIYKLNNVNPDGATLIVHTIQSLKVASLGYILGVIIGVPLGVLMAWNNRIGMDTAIHSTFWNWAVSQGIGDLHFFIYCLCGEFLHGHSTDERTPFVGWRCIWSIQCTKVI